MADKKKLLKKIAHFQVENPLLVIAIILAITLIMQGGASKVRTVSSFEQMMPKDIAEIEAFNNLRDSNLGQDIIAIAIQINPKSSIETRGDILDYETYTYLTFLVKEIKKQPGIVKINYIGNLLGESLTKEQFEQNIENPNIKHQISQFVNLDKTTTLILISTDVSADDFKMNLLSAKIKEIVEDAGKPIGTKIQLTGTPVVQQKLGVLIAKDRSLTQRISTVFVFLITMILFGTFTSALVPIIIVTISVAWLYGIMGYTGLPISTLAGGVAAMVIGIGIDYAIHLMNRFKNERKKGNSSRKSIETAVENTGVALTGAAVATILAFLAFLFGAMPEMNRFGLLLAIGVGSAFLLSIFGLPAFLIIEEKIFHKIRKKIRFGPGGEYELFEHSEPHPEQYTEIEMKEEHLHKIKQKYKIVKRK